MQDINLYNIQLSDIELFLNVAKYGSFTKAGEKMFMTQSWVSKRISQIERELDLRLFLRNKREVVLTPAGRILEQRLSSVTDDILDAIQAAHVAQTGASGYLRIGYLEWGTVVFLDHIQKFIAENPHFSVEVYRQRFADLRADISIGRMDVIFTISYDCDQFSSTDYCLMNVKRVPVVAYMNKQHRLAKRESITMEDLRPEPMLMVDQKSSTGYGAFVRNLFIKYKIRPVIAQYAHDGGEHIGSILINKGILLASAYFLGDSWSEEIARVPIEGEYVYVTAVWRRQNSNLVLMQFLKDISGSIDNEEE
jgi:DNA-binding transcriptional LysR family regulator